MANKLPEGVSLNSIGWKMKNELTKKLNNIYNKMLISLHDKM